MKRMGALACRLVLPLACLSMGCLAEVNAPPEENSAEAVSALTLTLAPSADATISADKPLGTTTFLVVRGTGLEKALVKFDTSALQAALGPGGTVASATLSMLAMSITNIGTGVTVDLSRMTVPWSETEVTRSCAVDTTPANSTPDCSGPTAWNMTVAPGITNPWVSPPTAQAAVLPGNSVNLNFDVTADVNAYLAGTAVNAGWIVSRADSSAASLRFDSREAAHPATLTLVAGPCQPGFTADAAGLCFPSACSGQTADCDGDGTCETAIDTVTDCGACGVTCAPLDTCNPAACVAGSCQTVPAIDGTPCSSSVCSVADTCQAGLCLPPACPAPSTTCSIVPNCEAPVVLPAEPSLIVTRAAHSQVLDRFSLNLVFDQLIELTGTATSTTALSLFQQLWDTQSPAASAVFPSGPYHCDDNGGLLNGFPVTCPRKERELAAVDPFVNPTTNPNEFVPTALVNRFDLAKADGTTCGEYRIVYGKRSGLSNINDRVGLILEFELPNPEPACGLEACRPIQDMWAGLANMVDENAIGDALENFYFQGLPGFRPVIHPQNLGVVGGVCGQVGGRLRTNQFMDTPWYMRQYTLEVICDGVTNELAFKPAALNNTPHMSVFSPNPTALHTAFITDFANQVATLSADTCAGIKMSLPTAYLAGESIASAITPDSYPAFMANNPTLTTAVSAKLIGLFGAPPPINASNIAGRAQTQSCAGCHQLANNKDLGGGLVWPSSILPGQGGFMHVRETGILSPAMTGTFLPVRKAALESFLSCGG